MPSLELPPNQDEEPDPSEDLIQEVILEADKENFLFNHRSAVQSSPPVEESIYSE